MESSISTRLFLVQSTHSVKMYCKIREENPQTAQIVNYTFIVSCPVNERFQFVTRASKIWTTVKHAATGASEAIRSPARAQHCRTTFLESVRFFMSCQFLMLGLKSPPSPRLHVKGPAQRSLAANARTRLHGLWREGTSLGCWNVFHTKPRGWQVAMMLICCKVTPRLQCHAC